MNNELHLHLVPQAIRTNNILDDYEMKEEIAKGAYASCKTNYPSFHALQNTDFSLSAFIVFLGRRCVHKISKVEHAVKVRPLVFFKYLKISMIHC